MRRVMAGERGNRTHPARFWQATLDLKSRKDTRALCTPIVNSKDFLSIKQLPGLLIQIKSQPISVVLNFPPQADPEVSGEVQEGPRIAMPRGRHQNPMHSQFAKF